MSRILCVGGAPGFCEALDESLGGAALDCVHASTGAEGLILARAARPDLVVLAWILSDRRSSLNVCRQIQQARSVPLVFVAGEANEEERISGFLAGAADFVVMPVSMREIALRVRAILRRVELGRRKTSLVLGSLRIDRDSRQVWAAGREVSFSRLELDLLLALYEGRGRGVPRDELRARAWGREARVGLRVIDGYVRRVRDKLGPLGRYIETVHGVGYRLAGAPEAPGSVQRSRAQPPVASRSRSASCSGRRLVSKRTARSVARWRGGAARRRCPRTRCRCASRRPRSRR
jgi:two-component system phosphate regulon response regulator PhoB